MWHRERGQGGHAKPGLQEALEGRDVGDLVARRLHGLGQAFQPAQQGGLFRCWRRTRESPDRPGSTRRSAPIRRPVGGRGGRPGRRHREPMARSSTPDPVARGWRSRNRPRRRGPFPGRRWHSRLADSGRHPDRPEKTGPRPAAANAPPPTARAASVTLPALRSATARRSPSAASRSRARRSAVGRKAAPSPVSATRRVVRSKRRTPRLASNWLTAWVRAGCESPMSSAARVKLACRATAMKVSIWRSEIFIH